MLKIKKGLANILENNNEPEEAAPLPPQPQMQPQTVQTPAAQPPVSASRQAEDWGELLIKLLASAPEDVALKLVSCIDREVLLKVLQHREDPYIKVALLLLMKK